MKTFLLANYEYLDNDVLVISEFRLYLSGRALHGLIHLIFITTLNLSHASNTYLCRPSSCEDSMLSHNLSFDPNTSYINIAYTSPIPYFHVAP